MTRTLALSAWLTAASLSASPLAVVPLAPGLTALDEGSRAAARADYAARLARHQGALTLVPVEAWRPERELLLLVMGRGMTWTDLHALARLRDEYQLVVACYDTRRPLEVVARELASALVELGRVRGSRARTWRMAGHSYGAGVLALALDQLRRAGLGEAGPEPIFGGGLAILMEAPWRGADLPWVVRVPGVQRAVAWVARRLFGRHDADRGGQSTFNHSPSMRRLRASGMPEGVTVELVTTREGLEPAGRWRHYEPTANWYPEELGKRELPHLLDFLAEPAPDPQELRQWTVPGWNRKRGLVGLYRALELDADAPQGLARLHQSQVSLRAAGADLATRAAQYEADLEAMVDTFQGAHTEFMWTDPAFEPWLRARLAEGAGRLEAPPPGDV